MLLSHAAGHIEYRLLVWRQLAYANVILPERQAQEYIWNVTVNTKGGEGRNIPNDNFVEVQVQGIKKKIKAQGANVTHASARKYFLKVVAV